ncbi:hypothetical protein GSI_06479 [Ganoderma sinense ZZ0214-1]|uniref:Transposase family Tnp2 protein n=1 Tax=Ganoderma sinense ZZ0214-1 TaxID=1077348 RepID=A0A2G8SDB7_9APHY|nr:hypothetical protein GSI_06479 [Ganoderma sinense ZZ0214-1]
MARSLLPKVLRKPGTRKQGKAPKLQMCPCCNRLRSESTIIRHRKNLAAPHVRASHAFRQYAERLRADRSTLHTDHDEWNGLLVGEGEFDAGDMNKSGADRAVISWSDPYGNHNAGGESVDGEGSSSQGKGEDEDEGKGEGKDEGEGDEEGEGDAEGYNKDDSDPGGPEGESNEGEMDEADEHDEDPTNVIDACDPRQPRVDIRVERVLEHMSAEFLQQHRRFSTTVEDYESDEDLEDGEDDSESDSEGDGYAGLESDEEEDLDDDDDPLFNPVLTAYDKLYEGFMQEVAHMQNRLRDEDKAILRALAYKLRHNLTNDAFSDLPNAFPLENFPSLAKIRAHLAFLSGLKPQVYDCCPESCMAYTGPLEDLTHCAYCKTSRFDEYGNPRRCYTYLPLKDRLRALRRHEPTAKEMDYRGKFEATPNGGVQDVFDSERYRTLQTKHVVIDVCMADHRIQLQSPPELRFHKQHILPLAVVPGPKKPKDFDSFLWPAVEEFQQLAVGIPAYDPRARSMFIQRAFVILVSGDIPAISMVMQMKGHNAIYPCQMCTIRGLRPPAVKATTHYVPLERARHPAVLQDPEAIRTYDPGSLPLRTHDDIISQGRKVMEAPTGADAERLAKSHGVKGLSILSYVPSLSFPHSFPYDFMHLIWENLIPNLVRHWTGQFKSLDEGAHQYTFQTTVWDAIGEATSRTGDTLPGIFGPRLGNIAKNKGNAGSADAWSVWTMYIAPVLLRQRFCHVRYYNHFVKLVQLLQLCLQFEISKDDIERVRKGFISWVQTYEKFVVAFRLLPLCNVPNSVH